MRAQLIPADGGPPIDLTKDLTLVGRNASCDLRLDHKSISKVHCVLVKTDGLVLLRDLGSTNGTRVNGTRVRRAALLPNDLLHIANLCYKLFFGPDDKPVSPNEATQQIDGSDLARLLQQDAGEGEEDGDDRAVSVKVNALPDAYPADEKAE